VPLSVLYEYGQIDLLHQGGGVTAPPLVWGKTTFQGTDAVWGVAVDWVKDLLANRQFTFIFRFDELPDLILADRHIVWSRSRDMANGGKVIFSYVPDRDGPARLAFLKDRRYRPDDQPSGGIRFAEFSACLDRGPAEPVACDTYDQLDSLTVTKIPPLLVNRDYFQAPLVEPDLTPVAPQPYPTMDVVIVHEGIESYLPAIAVYSNASPQAVRHQIDLIPILEAAGIDGVHLYHLPDELLEALANSKLRAFIVPTCGAGEWWGPCGSESHATRPQYAAGLTMANRLLDRIDDCRVYIWFPEVEDRERDLFKSPAMKNKMAQVQFGRGTVRYDDTTDNEFWVERTIVEANRKWKDELWNRLNDPARCTAIYQAGNPFAVAHFAAGGAEMTVNKAIFRGCFNATVAAGRGAAKAHNLPHGFDYDPWSWRFRMNHHPLEWRQGLRVYLHAGAKFLFHEGTLFRRDADGRVKPTETGREFCDAARYARRHPTLGPQIVKMAAMHGAGEWSHLRLPRFMPQLQQDINPPDWEVLRYRDWKLLDVFFPKIGGYMSGRFDRLMTGTPYGPLDVIPWDTPLETMKDYEFVCALGSNGCVPRQLETFIRYAETGGRLVLALGQLRDQSLEPRQIIQADLRPLAGVIVDPQTNRVTLDGGEIIHRFPDGSMIVRHRPGRGEVILFTTYALTTLGEDQPRRILRQLGERARFVQFEPFSDWLEVMANRKGRSVCLSLFHHGQIGFPSGTGQKDPPWQGTVRIDLAKLGLDADVIAKRVENGCTLADAPARIENNQLVFQPTIDLFAEFVLGPADRVEHDFYADQEPNA